MERLDADGSWLRTPLIDLHALALKRQIWPYAGDNAEGQRLLAKAHVFHASWLVRQNRMQEAQACAQRGLRLMRPPLQPEPFWQAGLNLATLLDAEGSGGSAATARLLASWLPAIPQEMQATLWCDMALYAGRGGQEAAAKAYLANARRVMPHSRDVEGIPEHYYPLTCARALLSANKPAEALKWLPPLPDASEAAPKRASYQLLWAEALLKAGESDLGQRCMDQLTALFSEYPQPRLQRKFTALSALL